MSDEVLILLLAQLKPVVDELVVAVYGVVVITARTRDGPAACTGCGQSSDWLHSRCQRHIADEAVGGRPVRIDLTVRRLYCENANCPKVTFAEQVDGLTVRYQRRSPALQVMVTAVSVALAGKAGSRLLLHLHQTLSWASLLNCLMKVPDPLGSTPRVLAVDDFALRRSRRCFDGSDGWSGLNPRLVGSGPTFALGGGLFSGELLGGELGGRGRGRRGRLLGPAAEGAAGAAGRGLHTLGHAVSSFIRLAYSLSSVGISPKASM
ncbi:transposase family protein [Streptomyces sp. P17]|uniref:transposase family protein n=1 Tax=Streptomyces sp. P17 TaxID=3074716 RepID=UPI0028F40C28|nr:transposase family protein [Streptomyces sp. P17]MDT9701845.1 hypothetical protein [Streptomyces sp. P17]